MHDEIRKSGSNTDTRDRKGRFAAGNPGKPHGAKHRATRLALELLEGGIEDVAGVVVEAARGGDLMAARIVLDKLIPSAKERRVELPDFPDITTSAGVSAGQQKILEAVAAGSITPKEAETLSGLLEARRKALETEQLDRRIAALENSEWRTTVWRGEDVSIDNGLGVGAELLVNNRRSPDCISEGTAIHAEA